MAPARKAAQAAASAFRLQDLSSEDEKPDNGDVWNQAGATKQKPQVKNTYGGAKKRGRANSTSSIQLSSKPPVRARKSMEGGSSPVRVMDRKRKLSPSPARSESLSTVYTPEPKPKSLRHPTSISVLRSSQSGSPSKSVVGSILDGFLPKKASLLAPSNPSQETSLSTTVTSPAVPEVWSLEDLGSFVWVRVDHSGAVFEDSSALETFWWPAKISSSKGTIPVEIIFFGEISSHSYTTAQISSPSALNILSMMLPNGGVRFTSLKYIQSDSSIKTATRAFPSPRKKTKIDIDAIEDRWGKAADDMVDAEAEVNAGLSTRLSSFSGRPTVRNKNGREAKKGHGKARSIDILSDSESEDGLDSAKSKTSRGRRKSQVKLTPTVISSDSEVDGIDDYDPEADMLKIPGEQVFCLENKTKTSYWPAMILGYVPAGKSSRRAKPKYEVVFLDNKKKLVERSMFYASYQEGFCTCKLGQFQSDQVLDINDNDDSDLDMEGYQRSLSPVPANFSFSNFSFYKLGLHAQFAYVKPVLVAILNEQYAPAMDRHRKFMQGGPARAMLDRDAGKRGRMREKEVSQLTKILLRWALREKAKAKLIMDEEQGEIQPAVREEDLTTVAEPTNSDELQILMPSSDPSAPPSSFAAPSDEDHRMEEVAAQEPVNVSVPDEKSGPSHPPRQQGCAAYERLSDREKLDYCTNILVPEAVFQILLWRAGTRTAMEVLSKQDEEDLHKAGVELSLQADWVNAVMQMRANLLSGKQAKAEPVPMRLVGGTSTRPKFK